MKLDSIRKLASRSKLFLLATFCVSSIAYFSISFDWSFAYEAHLVIQNRSDLSAEVTVRHARHRGIKTFPKKFLALDEIHSQSHELRPGDTIFIYTTFASGERTKIQHYIDHLPFGRRIEFSITRSPLRNEPDQHMATAETSSAKD